ncbi:MAG: hypothetical protein WC621_05225 [Patescibacteria group bacterium]
MAAKTSAQKIMQQDKAAMDSKLVAVKRNTKINTEATKPRRLVDASGKINNFALWIFLPEKL